MSAPRQASPTRTAPRAREMPDNRSTTVEGAVAEVMGNADLVCCVLGHVLVGIKEYNARALARAASGGWTRVSRAHWDACRNAKALWVALARRHFGSGAATLVPNDARANFFALCRKAQNDHMGLPIFMHYGVSCKTSLANAMLEHDHGNEYDRNQPASDWRVRGWRLRYGHFARIVLRLLAWHPNGKYAPYDMEGMLAYFMGPCQGEFENLDHRMGAFLYPNDVTDWDSLQSSIPKFLSARKYMMAVRHMRRLLWPFRKDCA